MYVCSEAAAQQSKNHTEKGAKENEKSRSNKKNYVVVVLCSLAALLAFIWTETNCSFKFLTLTHAQQSISTATTLRPIFLRRERCVAKEEDDAKRKKESTRIIIFSLLLLLRLNCVPEDDLKDITGRKIYCSLIMQQIYSNGVLMQQLVVSRGDFFSLLWRPHRAHIFTGLETCSSWLHFFCTNQWVIEMIDHLCVKWTFNPKLTLNFATLPLFLFRSFSHSLAFSWWSHWTYFQVNLN